MQYKSITIADSTVGIVAVLLGLALIASSYLLYRWYREKQKLARVEQETAEAIADAVDDFDDDEDGFDHSIAFDKPELAGGLTGLFKQWRARAKAKKMARKGYIKWYKIDGNVKPAEWVKPEYKGVGIPEYFDDDTHYLFPDDALVIDSQTGARVAYHHVGEPEPINLRDPGHPTLDGDKLEELLDRKAESTPPSWLSTMDIDPGKAFLWGSIGLVMLLAVMQQFM